MRGNRESDVVHESRIWVFAILRPRVSTPPPPLPRPRVSAPESHISGSAAVIYSQELQADVHQACFSYKSISSRHFSKEVYVLVRPLCHHLPPLYHLFVWIKTQFKEDPHQPPTHLLQTITVRPRRCTATAIASRKSGRTIHRENKQGTYPEVWTMAAFVLDFSPFLL